MVVEKIAEIYGVSTEAPAGIISESIEKEQCPYLSRKCLKIRKSDPSITIGTCTVNHQFEPVVICPHRFLQNRQIFTDCLHLLTLHQPGNQLHLLSEIAIPGGNVDYVLASVRDNKIEDFVGIELQAIDSTGTIWPYRQDLAFRNGVIVDTSKKLEFTGFGMNWKMTAKTTLVQLHHKITTFEHLNKHFVLVLQDKLLSYMQSSFDFSGFKSARLGDSMHIHSYSLQKTGIINSIQLNERISTDSIGIAKCLGLQQSAKVELEIIIKLLESRISTKTLLQIYPSI